jgi:hypothetical protein
MLFIISLISVLLIIWFRTDAWLEYCRLFRLNRISFYKDFDAKRYEDVSLTYRLYLRRDHDCFFVRLITCPICLTTWLGIIAALCHFVLLVELPLVIIGALLLYGLVDRVLG